MKQIEINLAKKKTNLTVGGIDLLKVNWKLYFVGFIIHLIPDMYLKGELAKETQKIQSKISAVRAEAKKLEKDERRLKDLKNEIESFKIKTKELEKRSVQVEKILQIKTNPNKLLEKVARSMPEDLWLKTVSIKGNKLNIVGYSTSYKQIGLMIENLKESPFFDDRLGEKRQKNLERSLDGKKVRLIEFTIEGPIVRYNPF